MSICATKSNNQLLFTVPIILDRSIFTIQIVSHLRVHRFSDSWMSIFTTEHLQIALLFISFTSFTSKVLTHLLFKTAWHLFFNFFQLLTYLANKGMYCLLSRHMIAGYYTFKPFTAAGKARYLHSKDWRNNIEGVNWTCFKPLTLWHA